MSEALADAVPPGDRPERPPSNTFELEEGRELFKFWMPRYIVGLYSEQLGQRGVALYASLAWWLCSDAPHHRPTLTEIGKRAGCSRSTVWRGLKVLQEVGVIRIIEQTAVTGRRAHKIRLEHPEEAKAYERQHGAVFAGDVNLKPPTVQIERAARSNCARGALNLTPPTEENKDLTVCSNGADTHTPDPVHSENPELAAVAELFSRRWMDALLGGAPGWRAAHKEESRHVAELLVLQGWTLDELLAALTAADRRVNEWPREFLARCGPEALKSVRRLAQAVRERQQRSNAAEKAIAEDRQRAAAQERFDALPPAVQGALLEKVLERFPDLVNRPGIVKMMAVDGLAVGSAAIANDPLFDGQAESNATDPKAD